MKAATVLRSARRRARISQRDLARLVGVPQSTVGRIEAGKMDPKTATLGRLLAGCGFELEAHSRLGEGIDRSQIREFLELSPGQRIEAAVSAARSLEPIRGRAKKR